MKNPNYGGRRKGAGRKAGSGKFKGEANKMLRVPESIFNEVRQYRDDLWDKKQM